MSETIAPLLYAAFALGACGLCLLLPSPLRNRTTAGMLIGAIGLGAWLSVLAARVVAPGGRSVLFCVFAAISVFAAAKVVTHPRPLYSTLYFVLVVLAVSGLLVLNEAEFLAVSVIIIYAGAILVTYLFVIMLAYQKGSLIYDRNAREPFWAVLASFLLAAAIAGRAAEMAPATGAGSIEGRTVRIAATELPPISNPQTNSEQGNTIVLGRVLMTKYVVAIQLCGILLLVSMIGAIAMARRKVKPEVAAPELAPLGLVGRQARPF